MLISFVMILFLFSIPPVIVGQDSEEDLRTTDEVSQIIPDEINFQIENMEQYGAGDFAYDQLGYSSAKGDFNGDGKEDLVLGAPGYNGSRGGVFIFFSGSKTRVLGYNDADVRIDNGEPYSFFGLKLKVGDVDNDGRDDLLVGG